MESFRLQERGVFVARMNYERAQRLAKVSINTPVSSSGVVMVAKFDSVCSRCGGSIRKGAFIVKRNKKWGCCT